MAEWPPNYQDVFWQAYPRRIDKKKALAKLEIIRKSGVPFSDIMQGVEGYARYVQGTEPQFIKHPTTWLNGHCWENDYPSPIRSSESALIAGVANVAARYGIGQVVGQDQPAGKPSAVLPGTAGNSITLERSEWVSGAFELKSPTDGE